MPPLFDDLPGAYAWLNGQVNYERHLDKVAYTDSAFDVESFRRRMEGLGSPHRLPRTIHIAGTRGKGSAALALEALLQGTGLSTAVYTSPHLREYRERVRINGRMIANEEFVRLLGRVAEEKAECDQQGSGRGRPRFQENPRYFKTVFEHLTALFFLAAHEAGVDWTIVETGLGGRLDATNVLEPGPVLLTRIGLEHTHLLGDTIPKIAAEKAAILKPGGWAVAGAQDPEGGAAEVFLNRAQEINQDQAQIRNPQSAIVFAPDICPLQHMELHPGGIRLEYLFRGTPLALDLGLYGDFQAENLQNALAMIARLEEENRVPKMPEDAIRAALAGLRIPGRMEKVCSRPELFADGGHCPTAAAALARTMRGHFGDEPAGLLVGMMADKDHEGFFRALAEWPNWAWVGLYRAESPRAAEPEKLAEAAKCHFHNIKLYENLEHALESSKKGTEKVTRTIASGSLYSIARLQDWGMSHGSGWTPAEIPAETQQEPDHRYP